ncbi:MAG TPA: GntR family transcriptional regulator [Candidatus Coprousia avicola]|nr:GntR family transcriptional regulator [Candidatus Coprousia avicola]
MLKFESIARDLQQSIEDGTLAPNDKLPTVVELCNLYGVSKITVRRAIDLLTELGLVSSRRGSGTYVKNASAIKRDALQFARSDRASGFTEEHEGAPVTSDVYDFCVVNPTAEIAQRLDIAPDAFAYYDCRVRRLDDVPICIEYTYMPIDVIPGLKRSHVEGSIYRYIREDLGLKIANFNRAVRAVAATPEEAERLDVAAGAPLLEFEQVGYLDNGEPFEYSISHNVGERYTLHNIVLA